MTNFIHHPLVRLGLVAVGAAFVFSAACLVGLVKIGGME